MSNYINQQALNIWIQLIATVGPFGGEVHSPSGTVVVSNTPCGYALASHLSLIKDGNIRTCFSIVSFYDEEGICSAEAVLSWEHIIGDIIELTFTDDSCLRTPPQPDGSINLLPDNVLPLRIRLEAFLHFIAHQGFLDSPNIIQYFNPR